MLRIKEKNETINICWYKDIMPYLEDALDALSEDFDINNYDDLVESINSYCNGYFIYYGSELDFIKDMYGGDTFHAFKEAMVDSGYSWTGDDFDMLNGPMLANIILENLLNEWIEYVQEPTYKTF